MPTETPIIELKNLHRSFRHVEAVHGLNLTVQAGRCYGLFGRNGAGKTTTIKCLLNLVRPDSGTVRVNPYFFSARTRDGVNLLADVTSLEDGLLEGQHYREGAQVSGLLGFDVPRGKVLQEIALNAGNLGRTLGRWTVP